MFLNSIKSFLLKKSLKKQLVNLKDESLRTSVIKVGLFVDESNFLETAALKQEIISKGIVDSNIKILVYRDNLISKEVYSEPTFGLKDLNLKNEFTQQAINEFISDDFDLLINYYAEEKPFLLFFTNKSKAKFKVGFSTVDKRLNHLLINIAAEDYKGFTNELFRYLKILNKI
ncbi:hypothetical protein [Flavobacterium sp. 5]|uniref:DUF6913 domain-containing protein n=1 Tax=Flavobacterium sp. 5 TaxID=2035199 RepID=UPI000C2BADA8|nr:hypothetical protein [Flavobacterium sp. 5]PKB18165.1 hypothetical protein CLU82_3426 [Flavobacterium sp. 5]